MRTLRGQQRSITALKSYRTMTCCVSSFWRKKVLSCMEADSEEYTNYIRDTETLRLSLRSGG